MQEFGATTNTIWFLKHLFKISLDYIIKLYSVTRTSLHLWPTGNCGPDREQVYKQTNKNKHVTCESLDDFSQNTRICKVSISFTCLLEIVFAKVSQ